MNRNQFKASLKAACVYQFNVYLKEIGQENILGLGIYTCEGFPHFCLSAASIKGQEANYLCSEEEFLFSMDEWDHMVQDKNSFPANKMLQEAYDFGTQQEESNPDWFDQYCDLFTSSCISVLEELISEGFFNSFSHKDKLFLMLGVSDSLISYREGINWSLKLNSKVMHNRYLSFCSDIQDEDYL